MKKYKKDNLNILADSLKTNESLEFQYNDLFYQVFESEDLGYIINVYTSNEKDENGDFLDSNMIDGGICTGNAKDAIEFLLD